MKKLQRSHVLSTYYAPRGHERMYSLGMQLAQLYLSPYDKLIGIIGDSGSGKSALIRGMFPGLELTNDDDGVYVRPLPLLDQRMSFFKPHTYHVDIRFENGFTQMSELADGIWQALHDGKRVVVEHFELVYPLLGINAHLLIGVGEKILIARPNIFGPHPEEISSVVFPSLRNRLMCHTAEDLCEICLPAAEQERLSHSDVTNGFVLNFPGEKPQFDILELEKKVNDLIAQDLPITYVDHNHVSIGGMLHRCTGPRIHVSSTGQIEGFRLLHHFIPDNLHHINILVGCVGEGAEQRLADLEKTAVASGMTRETGFF